MYETIALVGIGAGAAVGGFFAALKLMDGMEHRTPYVPVHKRTEKDVKKTEERFSNHVSVINIETEDDHIVNDMDPIVPVERPFGEPVENSSDVYEFEASVCETKTPTQKFYVCDNPQCRFRASNTPAKDGKHYCKNHTPGNHHE